jgi:uncharacterized membrane protein YsdA (DUF1294 family)
MTTRSRRGQPLADWTQGQRLFLPPVFGGVGLWGLLCLMVGWRWGYPLWLGVWGAIALGYYGFDKLQAKRGGRRIPERFLLGLGPLGGVLGVGVGMLLLRHKTLHGSFWLALAFSVLLHGALALAWWGA